MLCRLQAPSKTFLIGEYAILDGGNALLASTYPRFEMIIESPGEGLAGGIHPHSPAGRWVRNHPEDFTSVQMRFVDPYQGAGGFGASGAQFLFVNLWSRIQNQNLQTLLKSLSIEDIWKNFQALYSDLPSRQRPSGGDLVSQWQGHLTQVSTSPFRCKELQWGFDDLEFSLVRTNEKVQTHTHLQEAGEIDVSELKRLSTEAIDALKTKDQDGFLKLLDAYAEQLSRLNLVAFPTQELLSRIRLHSSVLAAKGCGAMGADVLALFYKPQHRLEVESFVESLGLKTVSTSSDLSEGLQISVDVSSKPSVHSSPSSGDLLQ